MAFFVVAVGRMKGSSIRDACMMYAARVTHHLNLEIIEVKQSGRTDRYATAARAEEGRQLLRAIPDSSRIVVLTRVGVEETSPQIAKRLGAWREQGLDVAFVIGGAFGLSDEVMDRAHHKMSISKMTLPHELARLVLLEQLYRVCTIWRGEPYHKGG